MNPVLWIGAVHKLRNEREVRGVGYKAFVTVIFFCKVSHILCDSLENADFRVK